MEALFTCDFAFIFFFKCLLVFFVRLRFFLSFFHTQNYFLYVTNLFFSIGNVHRYSRLLFIHTKFDFVSDIKILKIENFLVKTEYHLIF